MNTELTPRETEVLRHILTGDSNKEIMNKINAALVTVKLHVRNICRKKGQPTRTKLMAAEIARLKDQLQVAS